MNYRNKKITHPRHKKKNPLIPSRPQGRYQTVEGIFSGTSRRFGFVTPEGATSDTEDIFIPAGKTGNAIDGDRVQIRIHPSFSKRTEGEVTGVLQEGRRTLIGTLVSAREITYEKYGYRDRIKSGTYLLPDDGKVFGQFRVNEIPEADIGDKVEIALSERGKNSNCKIIRVFGKSNDFKANYEAILAGCGIETAFDPEAEHQAEIEASRPLTDEGRHRFDREIILTIDGADAKDLDDAVSVRKLPGGGWYLGVHIADVSSYVPAKTPLDRDTMKRGTSVYFVDKVVPMLPVALSNGACSLNAGEDKYTLSAHITLSDEGKIMGVSLKRGIIRSRVRGVYSEVNDLFENGKSSEYFKKYKEVFNTLLKMRELYQLLSNKSNSRGTLSLDRAEPIFQLDEKGEPVDILPRERGEAERMIEQFMLIANEAVATQLHSLGIPCVYRVHDDPAPDKIASFRKMAKNLGLDVSDIYPNEPGKSDFGKLLSEAEEKGISSSISLALLRSMAKAKYEAFPNPISV